MENHEEKRDEKRDEGKDAEARKQKFAEARKANPEVIDNTVSVLMETLQRTRLVYETAVSIQNPAVAKEHIAIVGCLAKSTLRQTALYAIEDAEKRLPASIVTQYNALRALREMGFLAMIDMVWDHSKEIDKKLADEEPPRRTDFVKLVNTVVEIGAIGLKQIEELEQGVKAMAGALN